MHQVTFLIEGGETVTAYAADGENLLEAARKSNVAIDAPCSGNAACGKCRVQLVEGALDSRKTLHISDQEYAQGWRLSCVSFVNADVTVKVPDIAFAYKSRMKVADLDSAEELEIMCAGVNPIRLRNFPVALDEDTIRSLYERIVTVKQ